MNPHALVYAAGAILLGAVGICFHEFAMQWQPVPAGIGMRAQLAYLAGALLAIGGVLLLVPKLERAGALLLTVFIGLWMLVLNLPLAIASASHIGAWNSPAEITFMASGALALFASGIKGNARPTALLAARLLAGASAMVFGFAHFNYIDFTASMVPGWIPYKTFWAWATGAGHLAAGLALVSGIRARLGAGCEAAMMGSFVVLLHLPRVIAAPDQHVEWIMLGVSGMLTGAALLIRKYATIGA
ncbi:MAG TPA: DoxX family membrane protein [Steroidobacteraceae bacterium]|nr:DoxX family membrane protein [Steroidobacteraceae bacterium]